MKAYKLTDSKHRTRDNTQWGENVTHLAKGSGTELCSDGWIHFYTNPLIAVLMNPYHGKFEPAVLWECETSGKEIHESLKSGCKELTTIKVIPLPEIPLISKIAFGILCAKHVNKGKKWNLWADQWLSGKDRSKSTAAYAAAAVTYDSSYDASAAYAAAAYAYDDFSYDAASYAYAAYASLNFVEIAEKALTYK